MNTGKPVVDVILWEHNPGNPAEVLRLVLLHPQDLRSSESGKGYVRRKGGKFLFAYDRVEVFDFFRCSPVIPENRRSDDIIVPVQDNKAVHLPGNSYSRNRRGVKTHQQFRDAFLTGLPPQQRILLRPARMREHKRIIP